MDLPEDAPRVAVARRILGWVRVVVAAFIGLALGASIGSAFVWRQPEKLPDRARLAEIAALVYPAAPPEWIGGENGPAQVPDEDWPMEAWWQKLFFGRSGQDGTAGASWSDAEIPAGDEVAYRRLLDAEAALRADGWTIDGYFDSLRRTDGTPTPDDLLVAHKGQTEIMLSSDGDNSPSLDVYPYPYPTPAAPVLAGAAAGLALASAWLFLRRRLLRRRPGPGGLGVAGSVLLLPSALLVLTGSLVEGAWGDGAVDLWVAARLYLPVMPLGLLVNLGLLLLLAELFLIFFGRRRREEKVLAA